MSLTYRAVSAEQQVFFFVDIREGKRWLGYLKVFQVPTELKHLIKNAREWNQAAAKCETKADARLLASKLNEKASLP